MYFKLIVTVLSLSALIVCNTGDKLGLYDETDDVIILNQTTFASKVIGSDRAWVVEFYNTWCGHCVKFAPKWKQFAKELKGWRPVISVAAVDCADKANTVLCRHFNVNAFPNFKLFKPFTETSDQGLSWSSQDKDQLLRKMLDLVSNTSSIKVPDTWPMLEPLESVDHIWDHVEDKHIHVALVFEEEDSYIGRKVILDTFQNPQLLVRRMLRDSVRKYGITEFPSVYLITRDGMFERIAKDLKTREGFVQALLNLLPRQNSTNIDEKQNVKSHSIGEKKGNSTPKIQVAVYMKDLESTLHYSFRQEIALHGEIEGERLSALKQFVKVLVKYFPGRHVVNDLLAKLSDWLSDVTQLTGDLWLSTVDNLQTLEAYIPDRIQWLGCQGSEPKFRGYPCGMWMLFHTLTVNAYNTAKQGPRDVSLDVLSAVQNYMKYFFGCQTCVENFLRMASKITPADLQAHNSVMWLWRAHNKANARLHGDATEDPEHLKVQFPPKELCPKCYDGDSVNDANVFQFLLKFYGEKYIVKYKDESEEDYSDIDENMNGQNVMQQKALDWWELHQRKQGLERIQILHQQKNEQKRKRWIANNKDRLHIRDTGDLNFETKPRKAVIHGWGFSNLDMGMCITFYLMCTFIIILLYYHFIVRRKYKPFRIFSM